MTIELAPEERYLFDFDTRDLPRYATDVLVVGGGIAGLCAALAAVEHAQVLVLSKDAFDQSNTWMAQGGVAAAVSVEDSAETHAADTERVGGGLCDPEVVRAVVEGAPEAIDRLRALGAEFDRADGGFALGREAGHSVSRILHAHGDATGTECIRALVEAVQNHVGIHELPGFFFVDLLTAGGRCVGVVGRRAGGEPIAVLARSVILAAGGAGRLYRETSNVRGATGDGIAAAYRAGARLRDVEFVQFHPTTLYLAGSERSLATEAVRGEGAWLIDNLGRRFLEPIHPDAELAPRDVVSRAIIEHLARPEVEDVFLDMRHWAAGRARERFPGLVKRCTRYGLDPVRDPIPVRPAAHYFIGGLAADLDGRTSVDGLFACGEASCTGLHGANRLASNSLLEGLVLGTRAGRASAMRGAERFDGDIAHRTGRTAGGLIDVEDLRKSLVSRMWRSAGIQREALGLEDTMAAIARWRTFLGQVQLFGRAGFELENLLLLSGLVTAAAFLREESRGTHGRSDFSERDDDRFRGSFFWKEGEEPEFLALEVTRRG